MKTFKHNGNLGDIIYSLPTIIALGGGTLYVGNGTGNLGISEGCPMPRPITALMVSQIIELLKLQTYLLDVRPYNNEDVDFNLDKFRERYSVIEHLARAHLKTFGMKFNLGCAWLENITPCYINDIIITRSERYISNLNKFNWQALRGYEDRCVFVGFEEEYIKFKECTGLSIKRYPVRSILEYAKIIKGSKLFIGNQSLGFALAEGMKHPRILEIYYFCSNCMPQSANGHIILNKSLVKRTLYSKKEIKLNAVVDKICVFIRNLAFHIFVEKRISFISIIRRKLGIFKYFLPAFKANRLSPKTTYAQYQEDIVVEFLLGSIHKFIDIGAADGITISNTFLFALQGAKGILFEPAPPLFRRLKLLYLFNQHCACIREGISDRSAILKMRLCGQLSTIEGTLNLEHAQAIGAHIETSPTITIRVNTLTHWISKYREFRDVDLISIDVEDHELNVLLGIDFNIIKTKCFIIETHEHKEGHAMSYIHKNYEDIKSVLKRAGYTTVLENPANTFWLRNDVIDENKINKIVSNFKGYLKTDLHGQ